MATTITEVRRGRTLHSTADQQQCRAFFQYATRLWQFLSDDEMQSWRIIAPKIPRWDAPAGSAPLSGQQAFVASCVNRRVLNLEPLRLAPFAPTLTPFLPDVDAFLEEHDGAWRLGVQSAGYAGAVQILTTPLTSRGRDVLHVRRYVQVAVLNALPAGECDLTAAFSAKHGKLWPNLQVGVRLCPLSPDGFRGPSETRAARPAG